jgi:hypothetical protein
MGIGEMRNIFAIDFIVMSPGQDIPAAIESAVIILAVFASKIERGSARRISHQNNGYCPKHSFSFWALGLSTASTSFSNTFLEVLLPAFVYGNLEARALTKWPSGKLRHSNSTRESHQEALRAWNEREGLERVDGF